MSDGPDNLVLRAVTAVRQQLERIKTRRDEIIVPPGALKRDVASLKVDFAHIMLPAEAG